jgi:flagellar biosynthetic protein FliP
LGVGRVAAALAFLVIVAATPAVAQEPDADASVVDLLDLAQRPLDPQNLPSTLIIFILLTVLTLAPAILVMTTSFTRIIVVFGFLRQAMATQQSPPNQVLIGLALILTFYIMMPTYTEVYNDAIAPYLAGEETDIRVTWDRSIQPIRRFMFRQVEEKDLALFLGIAGLPRPDGPDDVPTIVLSAAFLISELRTAFLIGFLIYIPFLIIDMVVASTLMSMGMMMLPPVFVSLPFKIIMFVLADGWYLLIGELVRSFNM